MTATMEQQPAAPTDPLRERVRVVHAARQGYQILRDKLDQERQAFEASIASLVALVDTARQTAAAEEEVLRQLALQRYEETGEKTPAPGVGIRIVKALDYDPAAAFAWAKTTGMALALDKKAFEKIAVATPVPCATVREVPQSTIAQDLGKALGEVA